MNELNNLGIGLDSYANSGNDGFGSNSQAELSNLHKALSAGNITGRDTDGLSVAGSGAPLKVESLEKSLKVLTFKESDIVAWRSIPKLAAYNTVEEYNRLVDYGQERGGFNLEGELPTTEDTTYERASQLVKFLGTTREVTHPMSLVKTNIGSAVQSEIKSGTMWILRKVDRALFYGNSDYIPVEFNGLFQQHQAGFATVGDYTADQTVIDLRGARLSEEVIEEAVRVIVDNFGSADCLFAPPVVLSNFTKFFYGNLRQLAPVANDTKVGRRISSFQSQFGEVELKFDKFLNRAATKTTVSPATTTTVNAPVAGSVTPVLLDAESLWGAGDAGDYLYGVTAVNRFGESALTPVQAGNATIVAGGAADLVFTDGGGATPATAYTIYRSNENPASPAAATFFPIFTITVAQLAAGYDGAAASAVRDRNRFLPDTDVAFILENSDDIWAFKQLAPLMKMDLAILAPSYRFMILLYGTPFLYQPRKMVKFINIGLA
jgi:hypothetical protein